MARTTTGMDLPPRKYSVVLSVFPFLFFTAAQMAVTTGKLGAHTAFLGKAGKDAQGEFLREVLEKERVDISGLILDEEYFTTLAFVDVKGEQQLFLSQYIPHRLFLSVKLDISLDNFYHLHMIFQNKPNHIRHNIDAKTGQTLFIAFCFSSLEIKHNA